MTTPPVLEYPPTIVFDATHCELGEGSGYDHATDTLWWFDIVGRRLFETKFETPDVRVTALPFMASALAYIDDERQLIAADDGLYIRHRGSGHIQRMHDLEADKPSNRSNDGRAHSCGAFWISTMSRTGERGAGSIYHFHAGTLRRLYTDITTPNAICFSPDGGTAYFADTRAGTLNAVAIDPKSALPIAEPIAIYNGQVDGGGIDGAVVDAEGLIWNARWGAGRIDVLNPEGRRIRTLHVPASRPSCPVFCGPSLDRVLVTSAWQGMDETTKAADPGHGQTFLLDPSARGRPEARITL